MKVWWRWVPDSNKVKDFINLKDSKWNYLFLSQTWKIKYKFISSITWILSWKWIPDDLNIINEFIDKFRDEKWIINYKILRSITWMLNWKWIIENLNLISQFINKFKDNRWRIDAHFLGNITWMNLGKWIPNEEYLSEVIKIRTLVYNFAKKYDISFKNLFEYVKDELNLYFWEEWNIKLDKLLNKENIEMIYEQSDNIVLSKLQKILIRTRKNTLAEAKRSSDAMKRDPLEIKDLPGIDNNPFDIIVRKEIINCLLSAGISYNDLIIIDDKNNPNHNATISKIKGNKHLLEQLYEYL